jgi:hypothetical protein
MSDVEDTEDNSRDSSTTEDTDDVIEEDARKLFDSEDIIPSPEISNVLRWLQQSFSLMELQILKVSLEKNAVFCDRFHSYTQLQASKFNTKGQRRCNSQ